MEIIVGTAGHIDHGKTALVKALTGIDADRLPEEKRRGITVDLGFAETTIGDAHFGFVDVPGHERFIKNMLAGACGIDIVLLVVAANEGVMPQTREHFDICRLLNIKTGVVALTKSDLVDAEAMEIAHLDVRDLIANSFLESAPIISLSSKTGMGIERLKHELEQISRNLPQRSDTIVARLPIDRSFSVKGFGAVVTGTLASGEITEGSEMELFPVGRKVRVRGLQTHGRNARSVKSGQRVAVNLGGINHSEITRGMTLAENGVMRTTQIIDVELDVLSGAGRSIRSRQRVRLHIGTVEELARIQVLSDVGEIAPGQKGFAQIRLENPILAIPEERFIIRNYSPSATIAGGQVLDPQAVRHRRKDFGLVSKRLADLSKTRDNDAARLRLFVNGEDNAGLSLEDLQARTGLKGDKLRTAIEEAVRSGVIIDAGGRFVSPAAFSELLRSATKAVEEFHQRHPLTKGMPRETLRDSLFAFLPEELFTSVISDLEADGKLISDNDTVRAASYQVEFSPAEKALNDKIAVIYKGAGLEVPKLDDALASAISGTEFSIAQTRKFFQRFLDSGQVIKVTDEFYFWRETIDAVISAMRKRADATADRLIDVPQFKEIAQVSRKYAIPLLEYFDRTKITQRSGEKRIVL